MGGLLRVEFRAVVTYTEASAPPGSMAALGTGMFGSLTRRHAIKITANASVEECSLAVGEMVGHDKILSVARMNRAVVLFLETVELANDVIERGVVIDGVFTPVLSLSSPSKKVNISNIPPFIKDEILIESLSRHGKLVSPIRKIAISSRNPLLKHIVSFRRQVHMILKDNKDIDFTLNVTVEGFHYLVYVSSCQMKCFGCGQFGHLVRACPNGTGTPAEGEGESNNEQPPSINVPNGEGAEARGVQAERGEESSSAEVSLPCGPTFEEPAGEDAAQAEPESVDFSQNSVAGEDDDLTDGIDSGDEGSQMEAEVDPVFKMPQQGQKRTKSDDTVKAKKKVARGRNKPASVDSDSDCSVDCSLRVSGYPTQECTVQDIKTFLKETKHARNVQIDSFFPDIEQFMVRTKQFISDGLFSNPEVYRLTKFLTKLNTLLGKDGNSKKAACPNQAASCV